MDYLYWITGTALGGLLGSFLTFDTTGLDFALTALFVVLFLEQWKKPENRPAGVMGILCAAASLAVFGADNMVIPAMVLVLAVLLGARARLETVYLLSDICNALMCMPNLICLMAMSGEAAAAVRHASFGRPLRQKISV